MKIQSQIEERWNWLTHGLGFVLSIIGVFLLITENSNKTQYSTFSIIVYSGSLSMLYFASTAYHYSSKIALKKKLRIMDHISIYFLIAGTYSPVCLITLVDSNGILLFIVVWSIAIFGSFLKLFFTGRFQFLSIILYLIMGWLIVFDIDALHQKVSTEGINYLIMGGLAYTIGIVFYALKKIPFSHVIWHLFVIAGSVFHYLLIVCHII